jgi:phenylacetic acid degradation operon negative regulatory protein
MVFESRAAGLSGEPEPARALVARGWDLDRLAGAYQQFLERFSSLGRQLAASPRARPEASFVIRSLLIHDYRRVMLHDPMLPEALLPADWPGFEARALCRDIYRRIWYPVEQHVTGLLETFEGQLPAPSPAFRARFGGLPDAELDGDAA